MSTTNAAQSFCVIPRGREAQAALDNMSTNLGKWMGLESRYRITTWSNRLDAIGSILRFGDRTAFRSRFPTAQN